MGQQDLLEELEEIDRRMAAIPAGQIVIRKRAGAPWAFRLEKQGRSNRFSPIGPAGAEDHLRAVSDLERRRWLAARRKKIGRQLEHPADAPHRGNASMGSIG